MENKYRAELVGVFGDPVDDNPTIAMMEAGFRELGFFFVLQIYYRTRLRRRPWVGYGGHERFTCAASI